MGLLNIILTIFVSMIFVAMAARGDNKQKDEMIDDIVKKVNRITQVALSKHEKHRKIAAIKEIEQKLSRAARSFGPDSDKLVKILMQGVRTNAFHGSFNAVENKMALRHEAGNNESTDTIPNDITHNPILSNTPQQKTKTQLINDIATKIQLIAKDYFNNTKTAEEKDKVMDIIKKKIHDSAKKKATLDTIESSVRRSYLDLLMRGVGLAANKADTKNQHSRRMKIVFKNPEFKEVNLYNEGNVDVNILDDLSDVDEYVNHIQNMKAANQSYYCKTVIKDLCDDINSLDVLKCTQDKSEVPIDRLCDGVADCPDSTDELNCKVKVVSRVHSARIVLKKLDTPMISSCFSALKSPSYIVMGEQNILHILLDRQIQFIKKYASYNSPSSPFYDNNASVDEKTFRNTINEVSVVLKTFSSALNGFVCMQEKLDEINKRSRPSNELFVDELEDEIHQNPTWTPKLCKCNDQHCANETCDNNCKRVCWQKHSLAQWSCQAVNGLTMVPIDVICDGKLDCFDETDEIDCSLGGNVRKFDAINTYRDVLNQVMERTQKHTLEISTRNALLALHTSVKKLQHIGTKNNPDISHVKMIRDQCFANLKAVFEEIRRHAPFIEEVDGANMFLSSINKMLVRALKYTHSGNDRLISPDGCYCRGTKCALPVCTRRCVRTCSAEAILTKYPCEGNENISIAAEYICNGKENCPNGDDEQCQKTEVCRTHHLVVLRHKIQDTKTKLTGVLGEMIKAWKTKATARLMIAENLGRPTPRILKDIIHELLQDLLMTYGSIDEYRRSMALNHDVILETFTSISRTIMNSLRTCGN